MLSKVSVAEFIDLAICTPARKAMLAVGEFGIGKTQVIRQIGEKLGLKVICFDCWSRGRCSRSRVGKLP